MKYSWLHKKNSHHLILFFNGWSCDEYPFSPLKSGECDVLMLNDYRDLTMPEEVFEFMEVYQKISVVAWSFGVWVAQVALYPLKETLRHTIAINGTLQPVDKEFGIPAPIALGTLSGLNDKNLEKFQRRMFSDKSHWKQFVDNKPQRGFDEVKNELFLLLQHFKVQKLKDDFYNTAVIGRSDLIFSASNQLSYWEGKADVVKVSGGHFCFYDFSNWYDIINLS
ncbi:DUF452 family protein [Carboxylicivirga sp. A043]|uniref:DUF452 family protein n=1 Tax=Carboxylicivirga litoralis TaxID=2816963 RepID=UPI0021CB7F14|nr:pimeloyl-ACP methyl esterase BioG family protein [Carboxylicivirga sp. A043]MCU4156142.1 DUF452 family protein [Carboxylicivirga sp. A043]